VAKVHRLQAPGFVHDGVFASLDFAEVTTDLAKLDT